MKVDGEEVSAEYSPPVGDEGLAGCVPNTVGRIDASRVEVESGEAGETSDLDGVNGASSGSLDELQDLGAVQERSTDISAGLTTILVVDGVD